MADTCTPEERSAQMRLVRSANTNPERQVRKTLYALGYRYRVHRKKLPGHPDIVFGSRKKLIFVHGCFWHRHPDCRLARLPKSKLEYWRPKLEANRQRDLVNEAELARLGWTVLVIWECETREKTALACRLRSFLES